jgi:HlyD family secretion protein
MKKLMAMVIMLAVLGGLGYWYWQSQSSAKTTFQFSQIKRGRLVATIGATGTLQAQDVVDVGAQVAGPIIALGADPNSQSAIVTWGSQVDGPIKDSNGKIIKNGTLLATIDPALYEAQVGSSTAAVASAEADLKLKTATLNQATADWNRAQKLYVSGGILQAEYDQFKAAFEIAQANVAVSNAQIAVSQANLKVAQTNLGYTKITSPVDGVVIDRRVNVGQTVVASLSAPSLFLIAKDLSKLEVWATVNEVDVGKIKVSQKVEFTADAVPGRTYHGSVVRQGLLPIRLNATMNQNVVTVVSVDDNDGQLTIYNTTNLNFIVQDKANARLVPNGALRWQPTPDEMTPEMRDAFTKARGKKRAISDPDQTEHGFVWLQGPDGMLSFRELRLGLSDNVNTEILDVVSGGDLPDNSAVVVGEARVAAPTTDSNNPFSVQLHKSTSTKKDQ